MATTTLLTSLKSANLLPSKIIPESFTPSIDLTITFPNISPSAGSFVRVSQVKEAPIVSISSSTPPALGQSFTFMLIDSDAPTPDDPKFAYWRHWVVTSISPNDTSNILASGTTLTPYLAPGPKDESGPHRYLILLFREPERLKLEKADVGGEEFVDRRSFGAKEFLEKYGLKLVGVQWMRGVGDRWKDTSKTEL
ncbi:PEBP-like protein [Setomelanomma holmii]|uniref:PEBP-like protein n=1 Tax=Setomelanomma holmii TaxID=210430 RepID=A0A9P4LHA0_9PLEO|nr:PEBP-like protein [Setomelanomma holmii]